MNRVWLFFFALILLAARPSFAAPGTQYVLANDDLVPNIVSGVTIYSVASDGSLSLLGFVDTFGNGINGGLFGANRIRVLNSGDQQCVFSSEAYNGIVAGVDLGTMNVGGLAAGSPSDDGSGNGVGLAVNSQYLYASYSDSNSIATFALSAGCGLSFLGDLAVGGLAGGLVNGMAVHGNLMVTTYSDGTIESFDISGGLPVANGDKQFSTATRRMRGASYPNSIDITSDGRFAIFGDTATSIVVEVSDISSGRLTAPTVYKSDASISSSTIMLSPDETILYVVNTQGDSVTALFFNRATGRLSDGCTSPPIRGHSKRWSYLGGVALANPTGNGGGVYVSEYGERSAVAFLKLAVNGRTCTLKEHFGSPYVNPHTFGMLSIGTFPPRNF